MNPGGPPPSGSPPWRRRRRWSRALALLLWWFAGNALDALRARGVRAGFDFLDDPAGFQIGEGWLDYEAGQPFWRAFLAGIVNTFRVALPAVRARHAARLRASASRGWRSHSLLRAVGTAYVETLRNVPLLVQLLMWYFAVTELLPDAGAAVELLPGVFVSKSGLAFPWPVWEAGAAAAGGRAASSGPRPAPSTSPAARRSRPNTSPC